MDRQDGGREGDEGGGDEGGGGGAVGGGGVGATQYFYIHNVFCDNRVLR